MSVLDIILRLVLGGIIGFAIGLTGIGGGVLVLPTLTLLLGVPVSQAIGTASLYTFITKAYAGVEHYRIKTIRFITSLFFLIGAIPANIFSALFITRYINLHSEDQAGLDVFQHRLTTIISITLIVSVIMILYQTFRKKTSPVIGTPIDAATGIPTPPVVNHEGGKGRKITAIVAGILVGAIIGATSVGGGVLIIPLLILIFKMKTSQTVGTSIFIGLVLVGVTSIIYGAGGQIEFVTAIVMAAGSFLGVYFGSRTTAKIPEKTLRVILSAIILFSSVSMLLGGGGH